MTCMHVINIMLNIQYSSEYLFLTDVTGKFVVWSDMSKASK